MNESKVCKYNNKFIYAIDEQGVHYTTDARFYDYMMAREVRPKKVVIYTTFRQLKADLALQGVSV